MIQIPNAAKIVSVSQMQAIERAADAGGHSYAAMMEIAGNNVARTVLSMLPAAADVETTEETGEKRAHVLLLVGPGNNGGDGLVCARVLHDAGIRVTVYLWKRRTEPDRDYEDHFAALVARTVEAIRAERDDASALLRTRLGQTDLVVDALLGTGASRPIRGLLADLLAVVRQVRTMRPDLPIVAVDCPSGLNCDTGDLDPSAVPATTTVTFAYAKRGHYLFPGAAAGGELLVTDIGTSPELAGDVHTFLLCAQSVRPLLPDRSADSHKGSFGKVILAVGSRSFSGAAFLAVTAAGRAGAGLVTGAVAEPVWPVVAGMVPEATWRPLATGSGAESGAIGAAGAGDLLAVLPSYGALVLGCGLGTAATTRRFVNALLAGDDLPPTVIDADGLNLLAQQEGWPALLPAQSVLTPHPAEMARLTGLSLDDVRARRWELALECAAAWNAVVLLKGPYTVIAAPDGTLAVLPVATSALATAGTGDVLAGVIGGLLAQGLEPADAAMLGAWIHGRAGLICAAEIGPAGVLASDLLSRIPQALNELRSGQ